MSAKEAKPLLIESPSTEAETEVSTKKIWIIGCSILIVLVIVTVIMVVLAFDSSSKSRNNEWYEDKFLETPSNDSCYNYSLQFASKAHVAGMHQTRVIGDLFADILDDLGYETYKDEITDIVLDHYNDSQLYINGIQYDLGNAIIPGQKDTNTSFRHRSWNAYSGSGDHTAPILYINNADTADFEYITDTLGIDLDTNGTGYIGFAKRGSRANQARRAALWGLKGLILFENSYRENEEDRYPNGPQMPNSGIQYGRVRFSTGCPGNPSLSRLADQCGHNISDFDGWLSLFPAVHDNLSMLLISPDNAIRVFETMNDALYINESFCTEISNNSDWQSNLPISTCIGGNSDITAQMVTKNEFKTNDTITNVYGYFEGEEYPNEIIMVGAHRDAWAMGACDDISGTVTILEIARSLSVLQDKHNWKPKRTIMFGSWDGEEWGLFGSVDFNERHNDNGKRVFIDDVVMYLNFDMTVVGGSLTIQGNPLLREFLLDSAKKVLYPYPEMAFKENNKNNDTNFTLYDSWWDFSENAPNNLPLTQTNSDFGAFEYYSGIPCVGAGITSGGNSYTYHTFYDLNGWLDIVDPKWYFAKAIAEYGGLMMLQLAQEDVLPFDVDRLAYKMHEWALVDLPNKANDTVGCNVFFTYLDQLVVSAELFRNNTQIFKNHYWRHGDDDDEYEDDDIEEINEILIELMKILSLKYPYGIPSNKWYKQLIWTPNSRYPYIWDIVDSGCNETELANAFDITVQVMNDASELLIREI